MKRAISLALALLMLLALSACGGGQTAEPAPDGPMTLSRYMAGGDTVWCVADGDTKDAKLKDIFVFRQNGTMVSYDPSHSVMYADLGVTLQCDGLTLGDAARMSSEELAKLVEEDWKAVWTAQVEHAQANDTDDKQFDEAMLSGYPYKLALETDERGNKTVSECIIVAFPYITPDGTMIYEADPVGFTLPEEDQQINIYGATFASIVSEYGEQMLTKTDAEIVLDEPNGDSGLPVDVEDYDSLFQ